MLPSCVVRYYFLNFFGMARLGLLVTRAEALARRVGAAPRDVSRGGDDDEFDDEGDEDEVS